MEIMEFLEPSIIKRVDDVAAEVEQRFEPQSAEFDRNFNILKTRHPESIKELLAMESLFAQKAEIVNVSYRIGLEDGIMLCTHK